MQHAPRLVLLLAYGYALLTLSGRIVGTGPADLAAALARLDEARRKVGPLEARVASVQALRKDREGILVELAGGRLTLREAAARFREQDRNQWHMAEEEFRACFPGRSDEERYCRQVLTLTRARKPGPDVLERLETEWCEQFGDPDDLAAE